MRRFGRALLFGFIWFIILWQGSAFVAGVIVGAQAGAKAKSAKEGAALGKEAGEKFFGKYGSYFLLGAAGIAVIGSATGILP